MKITGATRIITWGLPVLTAAVYGWLAVWLGGQLAAQSGGLMPFDLRLTGYDLGEARAYLRALSPEGFALYQGPVARADTLFPALMGLCFAWWMRPFAGVFGMVCVLAAMAYVGLDWGENRAVGMMLEAGPDWVQPVDVLRASAMTQGKFAAFALAAVLAARQSWLRVKARGAPPTAG